MGILGYPNMDDNNQDGVFGDYSDVYSNFSEDGAGASGVAQSSSDMTFDEQAAAAANSTGNRPQTSEQDVAQPQEQDEQNMSLQQRRAAANGASKSNGFVVILLILALVAAGVYYYKNNMMADTTVSDTQAMGDYFYDAAGAGSQEPAKESTTGAEAPQQKEDVATIEVDIEVAPTTNSEKTVANNTTKAPENKVQASAKEKTFAEKAAEKAKADAQKNAFKAADVVIPVSAGGRVDPFMPYAEKSTVVADLPKFDIVAPPVDIPTEVDPMINKMSEFKISGIMHDSIRPSAILTIDGSEQLVHKGDVVAGYEIKDITRTKVVVKYNTNIYEVSAGEKVNMAGVNVNPISTLNKQFGGAYTSTPENVIKFY